MSWLRVEGLSKWFGGANGGLWALRDLDLTADEGEFVVLLGPSGCGKSTLLQIVAGLIAPTAGAVRCEGGAGRPTLVFQRPNLFPWLTVRENVAFGLRMAGVAAAERDQRAEAMLRRMALAEAAALYPHELSGGMQQRAALARALILKPAVLLLDEPLAALDALLRARLQRELRAACAGRTTLLVTHSIREALVLADRIVVMTPRPGRVRHQVAVEGPAPRAMTAGLLRLERALERELVTGVG